MNTAEIEALKKIALIFKLNRDVILGNWIAAIRREQIMQDGVELELCQAGFGKLIDDFIVYLASGNVSGYCDGNAEIARHIANNDVSLGNFIRAFHLFEESYTGLLAASLSPDDVMPSLGAIDRLHHETISLVSEAYLEVKDIVVFALARLAELRDPETEQHLERTREYAALLARSMNQGGEFAELIYKVGPLHDIGKVGVRDCILLKPGPLTPVEYDEMKTHCVIGGQTIQRIISQQNIKHGYFIMAKDIVLHHHERYDGTGYPEQLKGEAIPLAARLFALADAYDTIVSKRPYKEALPHEVAVERILQDSGTHFDPALVKEFMSIHAQFDEIHRKYQD